MGFLKMSKLLRLGRGDKLDALLQNLRFMPGHRLKFVNFVEEERARAQQEAAFDSAMLFHGAGQGPPAQQRVRPPSAARPAPPKRGAGRDSASGGRGLTVGRARPGSGSGRGAQPPARALSSLREVSRLPGAPPLPSLEDEDVWSASLPSKAAGDVGAGEAGQRRLYAYT